MTPKSLSWWKWRLGKASAAPATKHRKKTAKVAVSPLTFVEMTAPVRSEPIEIVFPSGVRVRVPGQRRRGCSHARDSGARHVAMIPSSVRIFVCTEPQDMRRSFDALALVVRERLALDPEGGALFVFAGKRGNRVKVLWFGHNGYCICTSACIARASRCRRGPTLERPLADIDARALVTLLRGVEKLSS